MSAWLAAQSLDTGVSTVVLPNEPHSELLLKYVW